MLINQHGQTSGSPPRSGSVGARACVVRITEKGKGKTVGVGKVLMLLGGIGINPNNLYAQCREVS